MITGAAVMSINSGVRPPVTHYYRNFEHCTINNSALIAILRVEQQMVVTRSTSDLGVYDIALLD